MEGTEQEALLAEAAALEASVGQAPADAADWPGLGAWTLRRLVGHAMGAVTGQGLAPARADGPLERAEIDRVGFYRRRLALLAQGEDDEPADPDPGPASDWAGALAAARAEAERALAAADPDALVATRHGAMAQREQVAVRVLEVTIHHLDVRAALALGPEATPSAGRLAQDLLERLLEGPRPRNLGRTRFLRAATGRVGFRDPRFPVLT